MITFVHENESGLIAFRLERSATADDLRLIADALRAGVETSAFINLYIEVGDSFDQPLGSIIGDAVSRLAFILPNIGKIRKAALVTDKAWLASVGEFEEHFLTIDVRGFSRAESETAFRWITS